MLLIALPETEPGSIEQRLLCLHELLLLRSDGLRIKPGL
jgi:hypothetical protein